MTSRDSRLAELERLYRERFPLEMCAPPHIDAQEVGLNVARAGREAFVMGAVAEAVTRVEFRFGGGARRGVAPVEGFVIFAVPSGIGDLEGAVAFDREGRVLARQELE